MFKNIVDYIKKLIENDTKESMKRFIALSSAYFLYIIIIISIIIKFVIPEYYLYTLASLVLVCLGLSVWEKFKN
jgi:uncharacterized membrane protein YcgQ (UPF0703/DUF1980 family)